MIISATTSGVERCTKWWDVTVHRIASYNIQVPALTYRMPIFASPGVTWPGAFWTPDEEPVALKELSTQQIYRIDRDR